MRGTRQFHGAVGIAAPRQRVLAAFLDARALASWFGADEARVEPRRGGVWSLAWMVGSDGPRLSAAGKIDILDGHLEVRDIVYRRGDEELPGKLRLEVRLTGEGDVTSLFVAEDGYGKGPAWDALLADVATAWGDALARLKVLLEGDVHGVGYASVSPPVRGGERPARRTKRRQ